MSVGRGRPKGSKNKFTKELKDAIEAVAIENDLSLFMSVVRRAYKSDKMANTVLKKIVPDMKFIEATVHSDHDDWMDSFTDEEALNNAPNVNTGDEKKFTEIEIEKRLSFILQ